METVVSLLSFFCGWFVVMHINDKKHKQIMSEEIKKILEDKKV